MSSSAHFFCLFFRLSLYFIDHANLSSSDDAKSSCSDHADLLPSLREYN